MVCNKFPVSLITTFKIPLLTKTSFKLTRVIFYLFWLTRRSSSELEESFFIGDKQLLFLKSSSTSSCFKSNEPFLLLKQAVFTCRGENWSSLITVR